MSYRDRPGISPVTAALVAAGVLDPDRHRILDVGCGAGTDSLALAEHGFRVMGVDSDLDAIERANRGKKKGSFSDDELRFIEASATKPIPSIDDSSFHVAIDTLAFMNVRPREGYAREMYRVLRPGGLLVLALRFDCAGSSLPLSYLRPLHPHFTARFDFQNNVVLTRIPEIPQRPGRRGHARVAVVIGRSKKRK